MATRKSDQKPGDRWINAASIFFVIALIAVVRNLFSTWRTVEALPTARFWDVFWWVPQGDWWAGLMVWAPVVLIPLAIVCYLLGFFLRRAAKQAPVQIGQPQGQVQGQQQWQPQGQQLPYQGQRSGVPFERGNGQQPPVASSQPPIDGGQRGHQNPGNPQPPVA